MRRGEAANQGAGGRLGVSLAANPSATCPPDLGFGLLKVAILLGLYEKTQRPAIFIGLAAPRYFRKSVIFMEGLPKMERHYCPGAFLEIIRREKLAYLMERLLKTGGPGIHPVCPISFRK